MKNNVCFSHMQLSYAIKNSWKDRSEQYYDVKCMLRNTGTSDVHHVHVTITCDKLVAGWGLTEQSDGSYDLQSGTIIHAGSKYYFDFIASGSTPSVSLSTPNPGPTPNPNPGPKPNPNPGPGPLHSIPAWTYGGDINPAITSSLAATMIPATLTSSVTPAGLGLNVKGSYTRAQMKQDLYLILTAYPNSPNLIFWDDTGNFAMNFIDDLYYGIGNAFFMFWSDCGFDIAQFYRLVMCNMHKETTMNPFCAYSPGIMKYETMANISPGIIQLSPSPQCLAYQTWGYPLTDWMGQRLLTPVPGNYQDTGTETTDLSYFRLDDITTCLMMWGFVQRNTNNCSVSGNSDFENCYQQTTNGYPYTQLMLIWNTGNPNPSEPVTGNSGDYVHGIYLRWKNAGFSDADWQQVTQTHIPGGPPVAMTWNDMNVSSATFAANLRAAQTTTIAPSSLRMRTSQSVYAPSVTLQQASQYLPDIEQSAQTIRPLGPYNAKSVLQYGVGVGNLSSDGMGAGGGGSFQPPGNVLNELVSSIYPAGTQGSSQWWQARNWSSIVAGS